MTPTVCKALYRRCAMSKCKGLDSSMTPTVCKQSYGGLVGAIIKKSRFVNDSNSLQVTIDLGIVWGLVSIRQ